MNNDILVLALSLLFAPTLQRTPNLSVRNKCRYSDNAVTTVVPGENDLPFLPSFSLPYLPTPHKQAPGYRQGSSYNFIITKEDDVEDVEDVTFVMMYRMMRGSTYPMYPLFL
jgi:hypothetical protein